MAQIKQFDKRFIVASGVDRALVSAVICAVIFSNSGEVKPEAACPMSGASFAVEAGSGVSEEAPALWHPVIRRIGSKSRQLRMVIPLLNGMLKETDRVMAGLRIN